jgi:hypothetical protein
VDGMKLHGAVIFHTNPVYSKVVLGAFAKLWKATVSFVMSIRLSGWNNSTDVTWILMKFDV